MFWRFPVKMGTFHLQRLILEKCPQIRSISGRFFESEDVVKKRKMLSKRRNSIASCNINIFVFILR